MSCQIRLQSNAQADDEADQHDGERHGAFRFFYILGKRGDAIKPDVGQRRQRGRSANRAKIKRLRIIDRLKGNQRRRATTRPQISDCLNGENPDGQKHRDRENDIGGGGPFDAAQVQKRDRHGKQADPDKAGLFFRVKMQTKMSGDICAPAGRKIVDELIHADGAENDTDDRDDQVIEKHGPARHKTKVGIQPAPDVGVSRAGRGIQAGHASVTHGGQHHGHEGKKDGGRHMAEGFLVGGPKNSHRSDWLDQHDAVKDKIPHAKNTAQARG